MGAAASVDASVVKRVEAVFSSLDANNSGQIDRKELGDAFTKSGDSKFDGALKAREWLRVMDDDTNKMVSMDEFKVFFAKTMDESSSEAAEATLALFEVVAGTKAGEASAAAEAPEVPVTTEAPAAEAPAGSEPLAVEPTTVAETTAAEPAVAESAAVEANASSEAPTAEAAEAAAAEPPAAAAVAAEAPRADPAVESALLILSAGITENFKTATWVAGTPLGEWKGIKVDAETGEVQDSQPVTSFSFHAPSRRLNF